MDSATNIPRVSDITPTASATSRDIPDEDEPRICPLCNAQVRWFFINLTEKLLMCENTSCEYPFGYEDVQIAKEADPVADILKLKSIKNETGSIRSRRTQNSDISYRTQLTQGTSCSVISTGYSDINKIIRACNPEMSEIDSQFENKALNFSEYMNSCVSKKKTDENDIKIEQELKKMEEINRKIVELGDCKTFIRNEKYLKELMELQTTSHKPLLNPEEINMFKKIDRTKTPSLNVSVESNEGSMPHIHIGLDVSLT